MAGLASHGAPATLHQARPDARRAPGRQRVRASVTPIVTIAAATTTATMSQRIRDTPTLSRAMSERIRTVTMASRDRWTIRTPGVHS